MVLINTVKYLERLTEEYDRLWKSACEFDNIPSYELFVVFSDNNPYVTELNEVAGRMGVLRKELVDEANHA